MGCGMGMIKYILFIFNFIFAVCGLAILALGIYVHLQVKHITATVDVNVLFPSISLIVIGSIIFVISFFGCCGAIRESQCMTVTFASFLLFILLVQVAIAVYAFVGIQNNKNRDIDIRSSYQNMFKGYWSHPESKEIVDVVQSSLNCCGVDGPQDYSNIGNGTIPWSCCGAREVDRVCESGTVFPRGCAETITNYLAHTGTILGGIAIGIAGVELTGIIFALCLANSIRNAERRGYRV